MYKDIINSIRNKENVRETLAVLRDSLKKQGELCRFKSEKLYDLSLLTDLLGNEDPKIRKNAASVLALIEDQGCAGNLFAAYMNENTLFVRSSYLKALKKYNYSEFENELNRRRIEIENADYCEEDVKHIAEELKLLKSMCAVGGYAGHSFINPSEPMKFILTTGRDTMEELVRSISSSNLALKVEQVFCGALVTSKEIEAISRERIYKEVLFMINNMKAVGKKDIPDAVIHGDMLSTLAKLHTNPKEPYRFRVTSKTVDTQLIASKIQAMSKGIFVNAPSDYEIEIKIVPGKENRYGLFLKLHTLKDNRFKYRKEHVAASMNPVNAAMMVSLAKDYLKKDGNILDPFCGVGTLLIERNKLVPARSIYGIDTFGKAIEGARLNTKAAGVHANYINRNYFTFEHEYSFDEIITDMPEVNAPEAEELYRNFFEKSKELLVDNGIIIMYSGEKNLVKKHLRLNSEYRLLREFVMNRKNDRNIFIILFNRG